MLRLLVVSHSCVIEVNRKLYVELLKFPVDFRLVVPTMWREYNTNKPMPYEKDTVLEDRLIKKDIFFPGACIKHFYKSLFTREMKEFKPDFIFLDEEPNSLCTFQFAFLAKKYGVKYTFRIVENLPRQYPFPIPYFEKKVLRECDFAFACGEEGKDILKSKGFNKPMHSFPFGLDVELYNKLEVSDLKESLGLKGFVIGYLGRLDPWKGIIHLVEAFARLPEELRDFCQLFIVGSGDKAFEKELRDLAEKLGIKDKVVFQQSVPPKEVARYFSCMDVSVLPSLTTPTWKEQFGRTVIESMACEVPIIGSDSGEIPHLIRKCEGGLVFNEGNVEDLQEKMVQLIKNKDLCHKLAITGKQKVSETYSWSGLADMFYNTIASSDKLARKR